MWTEEEILALAKRLWENEEVAIEIANAILKLRDAPVEYPIYKRNVLLNFVVKFTDSNTGTVVVPNSIYETGYTYSAFVPCLDKETWNDVPYDSKRGLYHGQPVECRDHTYSHSGILRFYDAINKCTFTYDGELNGASYTYIEAIPTERIPPWMYIAYKTLEGI